MLLSAFDYVRPASLEEAVDALGSRPDARVLAGGQSLVNVLKLRAAGVGLLVDVSRLDELRFVDAGDGTLEIGAATTYAEIAASPHVRAALPRMAEMAAHTVDVQVRNRGTIGGNCCYADPCSNFPPLLIALDARLRLASNDGERDVSASEFFHGAFRTGLRRGELLRAISMPQPPAHAGVGYVSIQMMADTWALARAVAIVHANGTIEDARVVLGAVEPAPRRQGQVEERLAGREPTAATIAHAADAVDGLPYAIADVHGSAAYRRRLARVVTRRAVAQALGAEDGPA